MCPMPCNIYGPGDHYDLERSHVMSALVMRFVNAVAENGMYGCSTVDFLACLCPRQRSFRERECVLSMDVCAWAFVVLDGVGIVTSTHLQ